MGREQNPGGPRTSHQVSIWMEAGNGCLYKMRELDERRGALLLLVRNAGGRFSDAKHAELRRTLWRALWGDAADSSARRTHDCRSVPGTGEQLCLGRDLGARDRGTAGDLRRRHWADRVY